MFTNWAAFDRWEVTCVYPDTGYTLSRVYELLKNNADIFLGIYHFLADASLNPGTKADFNILSDFIDGLDASRRDDILKRIPPVSQSHNGKSSNTLLRRIDHLKCIDKNYQEFGKLRPDLLLMTDSCTNSFSKPDIPPTPAYHSRIQKTFSQFLKNNSHISHPTIFNRYVEHWVRSLDGVGEGTLWRMSDLDRDQWLGTIVPFSRATRWDPGIASYFVQMQSHLLKTDQFSGAAIYSLSTAYVGLMESHSRHDYMPPPFFLFEEIQDCISRMPESDFSTKAWNVTLVLNGLVSMGRVFDDRPQRQTSDLEIQYLVSLAQFLVGFFERQEAWDHHPTRTERITTLHNYLERHPSAPS